ncbi:hypothetical protein D9757_006768 [Collybiopsis confluens]|uniref:Uncharacterized protein n=1 Tax=Collybiopsis confluens TaxID=2823264 RepID=A0A8H5HLH1_9AGAR|nr:hypothetical protein D9757_006768 [Collybiopsis confluens]
MSNYNVPPLLPGNSYNAPGMRGEPLTPCSCSWAAYNLFSACTACQGLDSSILTSLTIKLEPRWATYNANCGQLLSNAIYYPSGFIALANTSIPFYAAIDPLIWQNGIFNINQAKNVSLQGHADVYTGNTPQAVTTSASTTFSPIESNTSASTTFSPKSKSNAEAIGGGVVGGIVVLLIGARVVWWIVHSSNPHASIRLGQNTTGKSQEIYAVANNDSGDLPARTRAGNLPHQPVCDGKTFLHSSKLLGGYMEVLSLFLLAVLMACVNHGVFVHFDGQELGSHTSQFWITALKNTFPAAVALLLSIGLKICLSQVALYHIKLNSYPLDLIDLISSAPSMLNTVSILFKSSMHASIVAFAFLTAITQAVALTSLFVPGTLTVIPSPSRTQGLEVLTVDFDYVNFWQAVIIASGTQPENDDQILSSSQKWQQLILRAMSSNTAPGWDAPAGCGSICSYTFEYAAPALKCNQLTKDDIWPSGVNISNSHLAFGPESFTFYNSTMIFPGNSPSSTSVGIEIIYLENFDSITMGSLVSIDPQEWTPMGTRCEIQNATYNAITTFSNNTQISSTQIKEWNGAPVTGSALTSRSMAYQSVFDSFSSLLIGHAFYEPGKAILNSTNTQVIASTTLFNLTGYFTGDGYFFNFSLSSTLRGNLSAGIENLFGNVTLAFVNEQLPLATTFAEASVTPNSTEYQYSGRKLGLIYGIVFGSSLMVIAYGLFCLRKNGIVAVFDLQHIVKMSAASTRLHELAGQPEFGSTLVRGVFSSESGGKRRRVIVKLEVEEVTEQT